MIHMDIELNETRLRERREHAEEERRNRAVIEGLKHLKRKTREHKQKSTDQS